MTEADWQILNRRLDAIDEAVKHRPWSAWQNIVVPVIAWLAAISAALLTAWFTAQMAGPQEQHVSIGKSEVELYGKLIILREKVFVGFERFIKTQGRYDEEAEEASRELVSMLDANRHALPVDLEQALRALNTHVYAKKIELSKIPKSEWKSRTPIILAEAMKENQLVHDRLSDWYSRLKSG